MPRTRYQPPERILGAADYSKHDELRGSLNTVKLAKEEAAWASDGLRDVCNLEVNHGRKRESGRWELAMVAFVASRHVDLQPWWDESTDELWRKCGFEEGKPPYNRVWERLRELGEECSEAFLDATSLVIQHCIAHDPRIMAHVHVDSTEDETHAALVHDCQPGESCKREEAQTGEGSALRPQRATTNVAREQREEWNEEDPLDSEEHARDAAPEKTITVKHGDRSVKRVRVGGCWVLDQGRGSGRARVHKQRQAQTLLARLLLGQGSMRPNRGRDPARGLCEQARVRLVPGTYGPRLRDDGQDTADRDRRQGFLRGEVF